jgi:thiamine-phosphate diphosphorylase/hydroxyethylthiazole kinase
MASAPEEQADLARIPGGLLINFGTIEDVDGMLAAGREANKNRKPVVFDPVGVGATSYRRATAARMANCCSERIFTLTLDQGYVTHGKLL